MDPENLIHRPDDGDLCPVLVVAPRGFVYVGLAEAAMLLKAARHGDHLKALPLWDSRQVMRYAGKNGSLGGLAQRGPDPKLGDEWQRMDETAPLVRVVELGDWTLMTREAWGAVCEWPAYGMPKKRKARA